MLFRLALRITMNRQDAEDAVQETLIKCWSKRDSWQDIGSIQAFATTICRNLALDQTKRAGRKERSLDSLQPTTFSNRQPTDSRRQVANGSGQAAIDDDPLERIVKQERFKMLKDTIDSLPEKQKTCLQLRDFEEMSYKEIASLLQMTEQQVKTNIFRARQTIKTKLQDNG